MVLKKETNHSSYPIHNETTLAIIIKFYEKPTIM